MEKPLIAITLHRIPGKEICGAVILEQQPDGAWKGQCSKCGRAFQMEKNAPFEAQVLALRN